MNLVETQLIDHLNARFYFEITIIRKFRIKIYFTFMEQFVETWYR